MSTLIKVDDGNKVVFNLTIGPESTKLLIGSLLDIDGDVKTRLLDLDLHSPLPKYFQCRSAKRVLPMRPISEPRFSTVLS